MNATRGTIRVYLLDDQAMIRAALKALIERSLELRVVGSAGDARTALREIETLRPDVGVVDIAMPGLSGIDALPMIRRASPRTRILIASQHEGHNFVKRALQAGADGYVSKDSQAEELHLAILSVHRGEAFLSSRISAGIVREMRSGGTADGGWHSVIDSLTEREREVFQLLAVGRSNKEIAVQLGVALGTIKKHRENLQRKLGCHSSAELARLAIREGLLDV